MDYVLFGMGYGATLMLIGWALRTFGPSWKYNQPDTAEETDLQVKRRFWVRFIQGVGGVIAIAGISLVFLTFLVMLVNPDDETGAMMSLIVWGFVVVALATWCWLYYGRFGATGVWSRQEGYGLRSGSGPAAPAQAGAEASGTQAAHTRKRPPVAIAARPEPAESPVETEIDEPSAEPDDVPAGDPESGDESATDSLPEDQDESSDEEIVVDPDDEAVLNRAAEYDFGQAPDSDRTADVGGRTAALRRLRERAARQSGEEPSGE